MAVHVSDVEVQQWIQDDRLQVTDVDPVLESSAFSRVEGALSLRYDTSTWTGTTTTPALVRSVISMLMAAYIMNRSHAEVTADVDSYGIHLESSALELLGALADGSITIGDDITGTYSTGQPRFFPNDLATSIAEDEGWDAEGAAPLMFTTGKVF